MTWEIWLDEKAQISAWSQHVWSLSHSLSGTWDQVTSGIMLFWREGLTALVNWLAVVMQSKHQTYWSKMDTLVYQVISVLNIFTL